ncbi:TraR/DksA family transcriptional regulator [uncultured Cohaesibacter sp.]|uniref:TraR/DksA family transcriptional regulator n=1 Tax=uncultured Cohaesibacter sp. TaxID=1002546 RepID=UPI0029C894A2|nr:TraR/DksA family transcriptional regulator [uncultured Cohaesibacter sp.]
MPISLKDAMQLLEGKRIEISFLSEKARDARAVVELDQPSVGRLSRMDALQGQAMAQEVERRRELELMRIEQAVQRLESGDFGYCIECDAEIPLKRLEIDPTATHCVKCAAAEEKRKKN